MGWNGSSSAGQPANGRAASTKPPQKNSPSILRGILAGVLICAALAGVIFYVMSGDKKSAPSPKEPKKPAAIKEVTPAPAPKATQPKKVEHPKTVDDALSNIGEMPKPTIKKRELTPEEWNRITNQTYSTSTEQIMSWVFTKQLGDAPFPIPPISDEDKKNLVGILISKNPVKETDNERTAFSKEAVDAAKKEMQKYIADGGDPDEFLQYYGQQLKNAYEYRSQIEAQISDIIDEEDYDLARSFIKKANELLNERGIKPIYETRYAILREQSDETITEKKNPTGGEQK